MLSMMRWMRTGWYRIFHEEMTEDWLISHFPWDAWGHGVLLLQIWPMELTDSKMIFELLQVTMLQRFFMIHSYCRMRTSSWRSMCTVCLRRSVSGTSASVPDSTAAEWEQVVCWWSDARRNLVQSRLRWISNHPDVLQVHRLGGVLSSLPTCVVDLTHYNSSNQDFDQIFPGGKEQTLEGSFSSVSTPNFASKYSLESSWRDLQD